MEKVSEIFIIKSENSNILTDNIEEPVHEIEAEALLKSKEIYNNSILFFEKSAGLDIEIIRKIVFVNPGLVIILFYRDQIDNRSLSEFFKEGIADCTMIDDKEYIQQLIDRYGSGSDESSVNLYNNLINKFVNIGIISNSLKMAEIFSAVEKVSRSSSSILISGESGTGKELIAKSIHHFSKRNGQNFVAVNTGAIPENLLEDELFGHVKGAFTSAFKDRKGKFEYANGGTIFLDEISNMPPALQMKLLRILQEREFERIGDNTKIKVDVRVIAATNKSLEEMVKAGEFREDLFFRLNVIPINLPPLRERRSDIPLLANYFVKKYCNINGFDPKTISMSAMRILKEFSWPGNIRHLENIIERMVVLNPDAHILSPKHIPEEVVTGENEGGAVDSDISLIPDEGIALNDILRNIERKYIMQSLEKTLWNKQKAAKLLNIKRTTLIEKLRKMQK